jgi:uncharacterized protein with von Willebrand factor type A (vWA) domain
MAPAETAPAAGQSLPTGDALARGEHFASNLLHFARVLRRAGLPVSTAQAADLATAVSLVDLRRRADLYRAASGVLVRSPEEQAIFDVAFNLFWSGGDAWLVARAAAPRSAQPEGRPEDRQLDGHVTEDPLNKPDEPQPPRETTVEATYSPVELLRRKDFAAYTEEEWAAARRFIDSLVWQLSDHTTRRRARAPKRAPYLDLPRTMRGSLPYGGEIVDLSWQRRRHKPRPLTVICDISGSMDRYSRIFLHFIHALSRSHQRVEAFVFGTRLTRVTRALRHRDVDRALDDVSTAARDWSGGTRIGESLREHNYRWARRTLGPGAVAIIISDGWDRGDIDLLAQEMARLRRSVHRLIWLNPLLGSPDYRPLALGIQAALPYVDDFLPLHNLASLESLALELGRQVIKKT